MEYFFDGVSEVHFHGVIVDKIMNFYSIHRRTPVRKTVMPKKLPFMKQKDNNHPFFVKGPPAGKYEDHADMTVFHLLLCRKFLFDNELFRDCQLPH